LKFGAAISVRNGDRKHNVVSKAGHYAASGAKIRFECVNKKPGIQGGFMERGFAFVRANIDPDSPKGALIRTPRNRFTQDAPPSFPNEC